MSSIAKKLLSVLLVAGVTIPAAAHAARVQAAEKRALEEMDALASVAPSVAVRAGSERRVTLNGAPVFFKKTTEQGSLGEVTARVAEECASGKQSTAFGFASPKDDGHDEPIALDRVVTQEGEGGVRASLCVFAKDGTSPDELHRVRYTLAHQREDGSVAVTTVVNASGTPLAELFPAEGDAPGSDLPEIARPESARRTLTAIVGDGEHAVRIYESTLPVADAARSYDRQMKALGYVTTGSLETARMYRRDGRSYVASFRATTGGSTVALAPFGSAPSN